MNLRAESRPGHIFLVGFMGSGKSTLGPALAEALNLEFTDLDDHISRQQDCSIAEIFRKKGEPHFRQLEVQALASLRNTSPRVIAMGGGAFRPETETLVHELGTTLWLDLPFEALVDRLGQKDESRPLWGAEKAALFAARQDWYQQANHRLDAGQPPDQVVLEALEALQPDTSN